MQPVKAVVRGGKLIVEEPTDLPDGAVVELVPLDEVLAAGGDCLDDEQRGRLHRAIDRGLDDVRAGRAADAREAIARLRATSAPR